MMEAQMEDISFDFGAPLFFLAALIGNVAKWDFG